MLPISILILTKNEAQNITRCLQSVGGLSDDVLVLDSGSTDQTTSLAVEMGAKVIPVIWKGYGATKNEGSNLAKYDWILSLDADEALNDELKEAIKALFSTPPAANRVFSLQRRMVYINHILKHGAVANEFRVRLFNRKHAKWTTDEVHEQLTYPSSCVSSKLPGYLWHHSYHSTEEHRQRLEKYAQLSARQMLLSGKKASFIKRFLSPGFHFVKNFILRLGFLDGIPGYQFAKNEMWYAWRKYDLLHSGTNAYPS